MGTVADARKKGSKAGNWLHGSDLPKNVNAVTVKIADVEEASDKLNCKLVVKLAEPVYDADAWTVNATNFDILCEKLKVAMDDDISVLINKMKGKKLTLGTYMTNDPKKNQRTRSLQVTDIK